MTIGQAIADANQGGTTTIHKGVDVNSQDKSGISSALDAVKAAEIVVLVIGNDRSQEHEGHDRPDTALPGLQASFAQQVVALNKPLLLIMSNGGALAIDDLVPVSRAIVEAFNPAQNTPQLASLLFGKTNRWYDALSETSQLIAVWLGVSSQSQCTLVRTLPSNRW